MQECGRRISLHPDVWKSYGAALQYDLVSLSQAGEAWFLLVVATHTTRGTRNLYSCESELLDNCDSYRAASGDGFSGKWGMSCAVQERRHAISDTRLSGRQHPNFHLTDVSDCSSIWTVYATPTIHGSPGKSSFWLTSL